MKTWLLSGLMVLMATVAFAATEVVDGIEWTYQVSNGEAKIYGHYDSYTYIPAIPSSTSGTITIPSILGGCPVTSIGDGAFWCCSSLTSVTIPEGVTVIRDQAFRGCSSLTSVTIPEGVTSIGDHAFYGCSSLTSVTIPEGVTSIGDHAFYGCSSLTSVTIPSSVTSIGERAFWCCSSLTSVTIPEGVTSIGEDAFRGCSSLTSVTIPSSVTSIGERAFCYCSSLTSFVVDSANQHYMVMNNLLCSKDGKTLVACPGGLTSVTIPSSVTSIGDYAFYDCTGLTSVTIPSSVTSIGFAAFSGCSSLTSVTIPDGVTSIGEDAFSYCSGLTSVTIPEGLTSIGESAFEGCSSLTSVTIPSSVTSIGNYAFRNCSSLTSVTIPEGVISIGDYAFDGCTGLTSVTIPEGVTSIGSYAFKECSSLTSVTIPEGVISIGDYAFDGCTGLTSVTIPEGVTSIGSYAFKECSSLTSVTIPSSVTSIGKSAFFSCYDLTSVHISDIAAWCRISFSNGTANPFYYAKYLYLNGELVADLVIPSSVTSIGDSAFYGCSSLTSVTIPEGVTSIGSYAFKECSSLTSVTIPSSVTAIGSSAFSGCSGLTSVTIPEGVTSIGDFAFNGCSSLPKDENGVQYESAAKVILIEVPTSMTGEFVIPNTVRFIHSYAFYDCSGLTSVTIPDGVTSIGESAFEGCSSLTSVTIPEGVTSIGSSAFFDCYRLTSMTIPSSVTEIGDWAFKGCYRLTSVTIPSSVTSIGEYAFFDCNRLTSVTILEGLTSIGSSAFSGCESLTSVTIPSSVTEIGDWAFAGCTGLTSVTIPEGVTSIGPSAFYGCESLTSVTIPEGVTEIGGGAFEGCSNLGEVIFKGNPPTAGSSSFPSCDGYYPSTKATEWSKVIQSGFWNNLRMISYQLVKLSFNANGGTGGGSDEYIVGMSLQAPTVSREGYTFKGWSPSVPSVVPETATTYTAQWQVNQYRMNFNANGGTGGQTLTQDYGSRVTAPTVTREGYTFNGWSPEVPSTMPATNTSYTAQWRVNRYTMTFDANGGEGGTSVTQDYGSTLIAPTVTREGGYIFVGWLPEVPETVPAENMTYTAQWTPIMYSIAYAANGGSGTMEQTPATYDTSVTIATNAFVYEGYLFKGWATMADGEVIYAGGETVSNLTTVQNGVVTLYAIWEAVETPDEPDPDEPTVNTPPSWSVSNYQNNMVVYAQVKDITTGAFIETAGSLLGAFDDNGVCRGVIGLLDIGLEHPVYQLTVCSDETSGEVLTLKVWDAATGEITELSDKVNFVSDTEIGLLWEPVVYEIGLKALSMTLNPGWNWCSINVAMPEGTTLSEFFTDWTPQNGDQVKAGTQTATYFNGAWRPTDFVMQPGMMYLIKNGTDAAVTTTVMGTPANIEETIDIATGWNWVGYTGAEPIAAANAFVDNSMFANGDVLKSNAASATFYNGAWRGVLTLTPGVGYKLKVASGATIQYAQPAATATTMAAPVAMMASTEAPDWKVSNYQYNMVVYASIQNTQGVSLEADGNLLAAFDANGICRGVIDPLDIGIGVKVYQLTVCSDEATESGLTLKLWDAATSTIYDVNGTIDFKSDTEIGLLWEPQVYTVVETAVKFDVAANVIGDGTVTGAGAYEAGETVTLTATPAEGYVFCGWSTTPVSMEATYSFTMPEEAVTLTAYFAPAAALNNYIAGQGFVSADEVEAKIQEHIAENNLKTPEEVEEAIEAHVASNGLLTPAQANQQTQDYIVANKLKSEQEVAAAIAQAIEEHVSSNGLLTPAEAEQLVKDYIADNKLMSKDEAKQALLDADEVFTADEMKALALGAPVIQVKNGKATVSIQVKQASKLDGEWEVVEDGEVSVEITPKAGEKASFYKFVVPNQQ